MHPLDALLVDTRAGAYDLAVEWSHWSTDLDLSYGELGEWQDAFEKLGDAFDLTEEFRENAII